MSLDDLVGLLARVPALAGMGRGPLVYIAQHAMPRYFEAGDVLFSDGEAGEAAYLIVYGRAVCVGESGDAREFAEGGLLGELAMLASVAHATTCVAHTRLTVLEISRTLMHGVLQQDRAALHYVRSRLSRRIADIRANLESIQETLDAHVVPGEARMEEIEPRAGTPFPAMSGAPDEGEYVGEERRFADEPPGYPYEGMSLPEAVEPVFGEHGEAPGANGYGNGNGHAPQYAPEYARVLSVLGEALPGEDRNGPPPEYDPMELPSPWPHRPAAA